MFATAPTLLALGVLAFWATSSTPPAEQATTTTVAPVSPAPPVPTTVIVLAPPASIVQPPVEEAPADESDEIRSVGEAFMAAWLIPGTVEERTTRLAGVTSPTYLALASDVDPANLPAGPASVRSVESDGYRAGVVMELAGGQIVTVQLAPTGAGWRVTGVTQGEAAP